MSLHIDLIPQSEAARVWPKVRKWIRRACQRSGNTGAAETLRRAVLSDSSHSLIVFRDGGNICGAGILELAGDRLHVASLGGELPDGWKDTTWDFLLSAAHYCRVKRISLRGRRGWERAIRAWGFVPDGSGDLIREL